MTTATPSKTFEFRNCLDLFSVPIGHTTCRKAKYVTPAFNSKQNSKN